MALTSALLYASRYRGVRLAPLVHIATTEPIEVGRIKRTANQILCTPKWVFDHHFGTEQTDPGTKDHEPTCPACIEIAERVKEHG